MSSSIASPRTRRFIGWCLAFVALLVLNLQGIQHYRPQMLASADICVADSNAAGRSLPDGSGSARHGCDLCCSQAHPLIPNVSAQEVPLWHPVGLQAALIGGSPLRSRIWSSIPRGPPLGA
jgi:hypothetical protein